MILANRSIYSDNSAFLVELTAPSALFQVWHLCDEALFLTSRLATVRTTVQQTIWQDVVENLWNEDEAAAVTKVRWRPSRSGGRAWASPAATPARLRAARRPPAARSTSAQAGPASAELRVEGSLGYDPGAVVTSLMAVLQSHTGLAVSRAGSVESLVPGTWRRLADDDPSMAPGRVRLYLQSAADVGMVTRTLHGRAVQVGEDLVSIAIVPDELADSHASGRGSGQGGAAPAAMQSS